MWVIRTKDCYFSSHSFKVDAEKEMDLLERAGITCSVEFISDWE